MALYPKAVKKLIAPGSNDPRIKAVGVILHVAVSEQSSLYDYFAKRSGGIESHFYVRRDGTVEQYRDTAFEADANYKANSFFRDSKTCGFISVETQGMGEGEWTPEQLDALEDLTRWAAKEHGFKLERATGPYSDGVGYHSQYPEWSPVAKSCPGPDRIKQLREVLLPRLARPARKAPKEGRPVDHAEADLKKALRNAQHAGKTKRAAKIKDVLDEVADL